MKKTVIMTKTTLGAEDGIVVKEYKQDEQYEITESLANTFIRDGVAFPIEELGDPVAGDEGKAVDGAPENKAMQPAQNKKRK